MLKFLVFDNGRPADDWPLRNAYLVGADGSAIRADITSEHGAIVCEKRESGPAALCLLHPLGELGEISIQTCLLPERIEPYILTIELARHRLMTLYSKLEEWTMFDLEPDHPVTKRGNSARTLFIQSLCDQQDDQVKAFNEAQESLTLALDASEELALAHSRLLLDRRVLTGALPKAPIGCGVCLDHTHENLRTGLATNFDYIQLPMPWRLLSPQEGDQRWEQTDNWVNWIAKARVPVIAGPLISFEPSNLPDWLYIWEHDYDTARDMVYEHVERVVDRYKDRVSVWNVVSGLHVNSHFTFNFEQLMDLTRMTTMLVKKLQPNAKVLIELRQPFGEYYSTNQRSIPPLMYADLVVQSGIQFDAFCMRLLMGQATSGQYTRDLMQVSQLLDQFSVFDKPVHLTIAAPSDPVTQMMIPASETGEPIDPVSGHWRRPWSQQVQSHWLEAVLQVAVSKPFIDAVAWQELVDHVEIELPLSGLLDDEFVPKDSLRRIIGFRRGILAGAGNATPQPTAPVPPTPELVQDPDDVAEVNNGDGI
jgi:glycosyl hydrolase family 10